jgi:hypothetical protein
MSFIDGTVTSYVLPSGSPGDADVFGSHQYGPLLDIDVPDGS